MELAVISDFARITVKQSLGLLALLQLLINLGLYARGILAGKTKPHAFSWLLWAIVTAMVFIAQWTSHAGAGSWPTSMSSLLCGTIGILALYRGESDIMPSDWVAFIGALFAIPLWIASKDPLASVLVLTAIDTFGYYPTFRKSWYAPHHENIFRPLRASAICLTSIFALEVYNITTTVYPLTLIVVELSLASMLFLRRRTLEAHL